MERRCIPFRSRYMGVERLVMMVVSLIIQLFALFTGLSVATLESGAIILVIFLPLLANTLYQSHRLAFTGQLSAEGFEMQTLWLTTRYVPLPEFVRVENWLKGYRIVFRNVPSVYIRRTDRLVFWGTGVQDIDLANQLIGEYVRTAYAEDPTLFRRP